MQGVEFLLRPRQFHPAVAAPRPRLACPQTYGFPEASGIVPGRTPRSDRSRRPGCVRRLDPTEPGTRLARRIPAIGNCHHRLFRWRGGSVWESNPPPKLLAPVTGFEVQAAHQHRYASTPLAAGSGRRSMLMNVRWPVNNGLRRPLAYVFAHALDGSLPFGEQRREEVPDVDHVVP